MSDLIEKLAAIEHERWSRWHRHARKNWTSDRVERWDLLAETPYEKLSEESKDSDRHEVREYWPLIQSDIDRLTARVAELEKELDMTKVGKIVELCVCVNGDNPLPDCPCVICTVRSSEKELTAERAHADRLAGELELLGGRFIFPTNEVRKICKEALAAHRERREGK